MILFHRLFRYLENWLLSNLKQLPHHFKWLHQDTEIPVTRLFVWVDFPVEQVPDHQVSQTRTCRSAEVPSGDDLRPGLNLLAKTAAQVGGVQQNNVFIGQSCANLPSQQRLPHSLCSWTKSSSGPMQM